MAKKLFKPPTPKQYEKMRQPYLVAIGKVALEWNGLQDSFAYLFWQTLGTAYSGGPFAVWHSIKSDRSQREMLKAAINAHEWPDAPDDSDDPNEPSPRQADLLWLVDQAERFETRRNDALHSPFIVRITQDGARTFEPSDWTNHPKARKLKGKDVLSEFEWYAACLKVLRHYSRRAHLSLLSPEHYAWPDKPRLPLLAQSPNRKPERHQIAPKQPRPPPRS